MCTILQLNKEINRRYTEMMMNEFTQRTGYEPSFEEYHYIEESYYEFDGNKDEFCKWWKKASKTGEWAKELKLRQTIDNNKAEYEAKLKEQEENLEFYRPYFDRAIVAESIINAIGKDRVAVFNIKCKDERQWRKFSYVKVKYIDNGTIRFINVIEESGWTTSFKLSDIEYIEQR